MIEVALISETPWTDGEWEALATRAATLAVAATPHANLATTRAVVEISVRLTSDDEVRILNRQYRKQDKPTNVLSFPSPQGPEANPDGQIGDIALAFGVCQREAIEQGKPLAHHLQHLVAHGVLHLLGYNHEGDEEAESMEALEREILATLDILDPYAADMTQQG